MSNIDEQLDRDMLEFKYLIAARNGNADAQYVLAVLYAKGIDETSSDDEGALFWLERAARQGHPRANYRLGRMYLQDDDVFVGTFEREDREKAKACFSVALAQFRRMAEEGDATAKLWLAAMYRYGYGVARDDGIAKQLLEESADAGCECAIAMDGKI